MGLNSYSSVAVVARRGETSPWHEWHGSSGAVHGDATLAWQEQGKGRLTSGTGAAQCPLLFIQTFFNLFELNWFKKGLTLLKNFQTKYERVGIERMNNFHYWNLEAFDLDGICHVGGKSNLEHTSCCELLPNLHIF
jgi:hypothetical protein